MTDRPLDAINVQFHAQSIAGWATALYWAESDHLRAHHAEQLSNAFAQLHVAFAKLQPGLPQQQRHRLDELLAEDGGHLVGGV